MYSRNLRLIELMNPFIVILLAIVFASPSFGADSHMAISTNLHVFDTPEYLPALDSSGASMCRFDCPFSAVREKPGSDPKTWNWKILDDARKAHSSYPKMQWLPIIGYGTKWAADPKFSGGPTAAPQRGISIEPAESPSNLYGNFVYEAVSRYKDFIHYWESWNEPDLPNHVFFSGNGRDFVPYQKACYLAAKKADPNCKVVFAGLCFPTIEGYMATHGLKPPTLSPAKSSFFEEYLQTVVKDPQAKINNYYFDVMNQHSYSRATDLFDYTRVLQKLMRDYLKESKPIWFTETGFGDDGGPWGGSPNEYCDYLLQSFCWGQLAGVQKQFHFQLDNSNQQGLYTSMLGAPKLALHTYKMMTKELATLQFVSQLHGHPGVGFLEGNSPYQTNWRTGYNLFAFKSTDGKKKVYVAFTDTARSVDIKIPATQNQAVLIDRNGNRRPLNATANGYTIHLAGATNLGGFPVINDPKAKALGPPEHLVGGATQIVVEE